MLREITREEVKKRSGDVLIVYNEAIYTLEELWDVLDVRFLVDEPQKTERQKKVDEILNNPTSQIINAAEAKEAAEKRKRRNPEEIKQMIRHAIDVGNHSMAAVQRTTGLAYETVKKYWDEVRANG